MMERRRSRGGRSTPSSTPRGSLEGNDTDAENMRRARAAVSLSSSTNKLDDHTRVALQSHFVNAGIIDPEALTFGTVVVLATYHPVYQGALRPYIFWRHVGYKGEKRPVFLTQLSYNGRGPMSTATKWYQGDLNFSLFPGRVETVSPIQAIIFISARQDGKIQGQLCGDKIPDLRQLEEKMSHFLVQHPLLLHHLGEHTLSTWGERAVPKDNLLDIENALRDEAYLGCPLVGCKLTRNLGDCDKSGHCKPVFPNMQWMKVRPDRSTCESMVGKVRHFDPVDPEVDLG